MATIHAKALYDNTAESPDELAFHKGDVVVVIERTVEGSVGWWKCSLRGQEGLAPANRLRLLSPSEDVYQTPRPSEESPTYEVMKWANKMPSTHMVQSPVLLPRKSGTNRSLKKLGCDYSSASADMYDVPRLGRKGSLYTPLSPRPVLQKASTTSNLRSSESMKSKFRPHGIYAVPPTPPKDPNYDIPVTSKNEPQQTLISGYSTLPNPRKIEHIYDVPVAPDVPLVMPGFYCTMPSKGAQSEKELYDTPPTVIHPARVPDSVIYDIPKSIHKAQQRTVPPENENIYDVPSNIRLREPIQSGLTVPNQKALRPIDSENVYKPLEYRCKPAPRLDHPHGRLSCSRKIKLSRELQDSTTVTSENKGESGRGVSLSENQRNSTVSTSSSTSSSSRSSCDSLMFGSPSPEPLREVTLPPEIATQRLLQLQETVCQAVPKLMDFVSSHWRSREHLGRHLKDIRAALEDVTDSVTSFLNFAQDIRGNAQRLNDSYLQARLQKQLSIVEDTGLILQKSLDALCDLGWSLDVLAQDIRRSQTPDQLERFVMVARTLPEDLKRLVSIINANSKLLFRNSSKEPEMPKNDSPTHERNSLGKNVPQRDDDYVQLQTKTEFENQQKSEAKNNIKLDTKGENDIKQASRPQTPCPDITSPCKPVISEHCRLYFAAIKKALAVYVTSLEQQQPPEKFISHSKLVIMVGQRLIDSLFSEAQNRQDSQEVLYKSNHLCALLKQLAVATKKAALHFPDKVALQEAKDFAKELAQKSHSFRMSLDI